MTNQEKFYITTAIPYVNGQPHIGHVLEWLQADTVARYQRLLGKEVVFCSGADENSLKNVRAAEKASVSTQEWLDQYSEIFRLAYQKIGVELTEFRRGSDQKKHWPGVQKLWRLTDQAGDIYQKTYSGLYCVGCELFYTENELIDGKCPEHLIEPELVKAENYFFRLSKYQKQIRDLIESDQLLVVSSQYKNEMLAFIDQGLEDFSVSRSVERARGIGVPVPGDDRQVMYVWFDALAIYLTAIGWGYDQANFEKYWPADLHWIGKGINRFHSVYWIGMLLSAGLPIPKAVSVHGYLTTDGQKMSKSLGNVLDPFVLIDEVGLEAVRYFLLKAIPTHSDGDVSRQKIIETYTADLANGLGNLASRVAKLAASCQLGGFDTENLRLNQTYSQYLDSYQTCQAVGWVMGQVAATDAFLSERQPWRLQRQERVEVLKHAIKRIISIAYHLQPFLPDSSKKILSHFGADSIKPLAPLFPRLLT